MLTQQQANVLRFVKNYQTANGGRSPIYTEIASGVGLAAKSTVCRLVDQLEQRGFIQRLGRAPWVQIIIVRPVADAPRIPVYDANTLQLREYLP